MSIYGFGMFEGRGAIFRKNVFKELKGFDSSLPGEDFDFAFRTSLLGYTIKYEEETTSNEQVTETILEWHKQRKRWLANYVLSFLKNLPSLYKTKNVSLSSKISASFFTFNLLWAFTFNFFGPLILINEFKYSTEYSLICIISFCLIVFFYCSSYIFKHKKISLILYIPIMIIYYWIFTIIQTWVLINEKVLNTRLFYKKALHRKPLLNEI